MNEERVEVRAQGADAAEQGQAASQAERAGAEGLPGVIDTLARYPAATILDLNAVAKIFRRSPKSVYRAVRNRTLCPPVKLFGKACWTAGSILQHLQARLDAAQREAEKEARRLAKIAP